MSDDTPDIPSIEEMISELGWMDNDPLFKELFKQQAETLSKMLFDDDPDPDYSWVFERYFK